MNAGVIAALLWAWIFGALLVTALWPRQRPLRADLPLIAALALLLGLAATSVTYFAASIVFARAGLAAFALEAAIAALLLVRLRCRPRLLAPAAGGAADAAGFGLLGLVAGPAVVAAIVLAARSYHAEPYGGWDAWAIWNLHARVMARAGPEWPQLLAAPQLSWTHPDYPRLVPASVARAWAWAGGESTAAAGAVSAAFAVATLGLLLAAVARVRGAGLAWLGGLVLITTPFFVTFATNEHADIPLGAFMLAAAVLAAREEEGFEVLAAGCAAGAAWAKNEGLLFALVFAVLGVAAAIRRGERRAALRLGGALVLGLLPLAYFKLRLAPTNDLLAAPLGPRIAQLWDSHRHALILSSLRRDLAQFGEWQVAPYAALALPFLAWRGRRRLAARERLIPALLALMLAGYYVVYLLTPQDLAWHIDTSLVRLLMQLWPLALLGWCLVLPAAVTPPDRAARRRAVWPIVAVNGAAVAVLLACFSRQPAANELEFRRGIAAVPDEGWFSIERLDRTTWIWSRGDATLQLHVSPPGPVENITLRFALRSLVPREVTLRWGARVLWRGRVGERDFVAVEVPRLTLPAGRATLELTTDVPGIAEASDPGARRLAFAVYDFSIR